MPMMFPHTNKPVITNDTVVGPGWKLDLDHRWHSIVDKTIDDGLTHLNIEQEPFSGTLFEEAMKKRREMLGPTGWSGKVSKDHISSSNGVTYYQFQSMGLEARGNVTVWITLFITGGKMTVVECGGLERDEARNQVICDEVVKKFQGNGK
jgi:hypothetical protein